MPTRIEIHPTARIAAYAVGCALIAAVCIFGLKRLLQSEGSSPVRLTKELNLPTAGAEFLVPVIQLQIGDATRESNWSAALAALLSGKTEAPVDGGRVDVLTEYYAIEVDRLEKWHESIGQASHYGLKTKKIPVVALMIPSDSWPLSPATRTKILLIDETCTSKGIKLVLLCRVGDGSGNGASFPIRL